MSDGWETGSSREEGHLDWVIIRLGTSGYLNRIVIDTAYFKGNFLQQVKVKGGLSATDVRKTPSGTK
jgi:allantoicase